MRLAVIDCGTNTFNLLIVELQNNRAFTRIYNTRIPVKLGEGAIQQGYIAMEAYQRAVNAIAEFKRDISNYQPQKTLAFATSAIRDAANGRELVKEVESKFDISIDVINGEKEAELIYLGIRDAVQLNNSVSLIMDIGGGSNEFILANKFGVLWKQSFNIGAARLLQRFNPSNPITTNEIESINNYLEAELLSLTEAVKKHAPDELIGSSGAFESIIEMINSELQGEAFLSHKTEYEINLEQHFKISDLIIKSSLEQRKQIKGLVPMRLDMMVISCLMMDFVLKRYNLKKMRVSTYSLKEGALVDFISRQSS